MPVEDTARVSYTYRIRYVDLEYFRVFRIKDKEGLPLYDQVLKNPGEIVLTETLAKIFFPEGSGRTRREVKWGGEVYGEHESCRCFGSTQGNRFWNL